MKRFFLIFVSIVLISTRSIAQESERDSLSRVILAEAKQSKLYQYHYDNICVLKNVATLFNDGDAERASYLKEYNSKYGSIFGKAKTVQEAVKLLNKKGDSYIKYIMYKEAARIGREKNAQLEAGSTL